ncbi:hypothetical protein NS331_15095 [Pseudacidovorax intermedius]|uniref:HTH gntR-type domain-containing protein n=1 Tax=Pseudacidovorax intermedius TaxID=433924 RepID=A0A147GRA2_9BURK|nr:hypothetical protein NS331_15095 [Pseudacidovorax intermedius]
MSPLVPPPRTLIDGAQPVPLYYQVARDLEKRITSRQLKPGDPLPTELQLCESYGVSRITVRKAMEDLVAKRLVMRQRGLGTFVAEASYANRLVSHVGSLHDAVAYSDALTFRQLSRETLPASGFVAEALQLPADSQVQKIVRVGCVDADAVSLTDIYVPSDLAARLTKIPTRGNVSISRQLEEQLGEPLVRVEQTVVPVAVTELIAEHMGLKLRSPILQIRRLYTAASGRHVELAVVHYHPQRYTFKIELARSAGRI